MPWAVRQEVSFLSLVFLFSSSGHSMSCCKRAYVADGCLQPISNLLDKCSVNLYNKYVWWLWQLWITGCLCFIFLFGSIFKAKDPSLFSSLLHHLFQPTQKQFHISGSILAVFFQYILIFSTNSELCILEYCCPLSYGMVSLGIIIIHKLLAKYGKADKKRMKMFTLSSF